MAQSERSRYAAVSSAWINYQKVYMGRAEKDIKLDIPQQFADIFWLGVLYGEERLERA